MASVPGEIRFKAVPFYKIAPGSTTRRLYRFHNRGTVAFKVDGITLHPATSLDIHGTEFEVSYSRGVPGADEEVVWGTYDLVLSAV